MLTHQEIARLCRSIQLLLRSGVHLADGLHLLSRELPEPMDGILREMGRELDGGAALAEAAEHTGAFPAYACRLLGIGEETGRLEETLEAISAYYTELHQVRERLRTAVIWPGMILVLMLAVTGVLLTRVLPVFDRVYGSLGLRMTGAAGLLLHLGRGLRSAFPVIMGLLLLLTAVAAVLRRWTAARNWAGDRLRRRWGDRGLARAFHNAHFVRGFSLGLCSGLPMETSAELACGLLEGIPGAAMRCRACAEAMASGAEPAEELEKAGILTPARSRLLRLGFRSGSGDAVIRDMSLEMMEEAWTQLDRSIARIEPAMVLAASVLVGMILLAAMLPLLDVLAAMG